MSVHRVVALLPERVAAFELGIVVEVFGLDRPELDVPWWYELTLCTEHPGVLPATAGGFAFVVEHGLEALGGRGHDHRAELERGAVGGRAGGGAAVGRAARLDLQRRLPARRDGPAGGARGGDALALRGAARGASTRS